MIAVDQAVHPAEPYGAKAPTNAIGIVLGRSRKITLRISFGSSHHAVALALAQKNDRFRSIEGRGRGVVSQIQAE